MELDSLDSLLLYIVIAYFSYFFIGLAHRIENRSVFLKNVCYFIAILILSIMAGMRYNVGTDFRNYNYRFDYLRAHSWDYAFLNTRAEWGFAFISKLLANYTSNKFIFGFYSFLTLGIVVKALDEQYPEWMHRSMYMIYLFTYFYFSFNLMRQNIALAIIFYSLKYISDKKVIQFSISVLIASLFHVTALIYIPAYFIYNIKEEKKSVLAEMIFICLGFILSVSFRNILRFMISLGIPYITKFTYLFNESTSGQNRDFFFRLAIGIVFALFSGGLQDNFGDFRVRRLISFYYVGVAMSFAGFLNPFFKRIAFYYLISELELIAQLPYTQEKLEGQLLMKETLILLYITIFVIIAFILKQHHLIPYRIY